MGSAAFLVAACRYLGDRLIEAWESEGRADAMAYRAGRAVDAVTAADAEQDPVVVEARRQIIEHCLYGVDINPMAVEMAKLSLWLVSMDPGRPFTFLDDRLVAGDSLLGVHNMEQIQSVHMKPGQQTDILAEQARQLVDQLTRERLAITAIKGVDLPALQEKRERLEEVNRHSRRLRLVGDLIAGAALATCASGRVPWYEEEGGERVRDLFPRAAWIVQRIMEEGSRTTPRWCGRLGLRRRSGWGPSCRRGRWSGGRCIGRWCFRRCFRAGLGLTRLWGIRHF